MVQITVQVEGMACSMCEVHVNDAVRNAFQIKKVTSSHKKGTTQIVCESEIDEAQLRAAIEKTGYHVGKISIEPYVRKGLFSFRK